MNKPYSFSESSSNMIPSFVCYADILGYSQLSIEANKSGQGEQFLAKLRDALSKAYERMRKRANGWGGDEYFSIKVFTDNIVVGYPIPLYKKRGDYGESELGEIFSIFAEFQVGLAMEGFLIRGGIAFGNHYMDDEIVFGDALIEAVAQDKGGGPPRISLAPSAVKMLQRHIGFYGEANWAPQFRDTLSDSDGTIFLNYLDEAFLAYPDGGVFFEVIESHKNTITDGLKTYKGSPGVRSKYEWAARYHNFICKEFAEDNPVSSDPDADEMLASAAAEAQLLNNYLIDIEALAAVPSRINIKPIKPYE
jgi:hypothetical protein